MFTLNEKDRYNRHRDRRRRVMKLNFEVKEYNYENRIGNLKAEAVGVTKSEKHFPIFEGGLIFKPLSKSKPFTTPLFAYVEVFWSTVISTYFMEAPIYSLAICHGYENANEKYYDDGTIVPFIHRKDEHLMNLLEFYRAYPDEKVDIDSYVNYCMMFYDYTDILESNFFKEHEEFAEQLALHVLVSILKGDQNCHYENVAFVCDENDNILRVAPMIDHEFSTYFLFMDDRQDNLFWFDQLTRSIEGREVKEHEYDCFKDPKEIQLMEKSAVCLHKNLVYIKNRFPKLTESFLSNLKCFEQDLNEHPEQFEFIKNPAYKSQMCSYYFTIGKARYKDEDEEKAKKYEEVYGNRFEEIEFKSCNLLAGLEIKKTIELMKEVLE